MKLENKEVRITSLDVIRGVALLGLLPMNILAFALPLAAYLNPFAYQPDLIVTHISHVINALVFDQKMMGLFSLLFGVSIMLMTQSNKDRGLAPGWRHYLRSFWLLLFGLAHTILLWDGDILFLYAAIAFFVYPFTYVSVKLLLTVSLLAFIYALFQPISQHVFFSDLDAIPEYTQFWFPSVEHVAKQTEILLGSYIDTVRFRAGESPIDNTEINSAMIMSVFAEVIAVIVALMTLGMAMGKACFFQKKTSGNLKNISLILIVLAWVMIAVGQIVFYQYNWQMEFGLGLGRLFKLVTLPVLVFCYVVVIKYWLENGMPDFLRLALSRVGRMAFTNYIAQSAMMTTLFYGYGGGLFGSLNRAELWAVVLTVWLIQIVFSYYWLRSFSIGPLEYVWRMLSCSGRKAKTA